MFDKEGDLKNSIPNTMLISIVHPNPSKNDLSQRIIEKTGFDLKERLKFTCTSNYKDIYKDLDKPLSQQQSQTAKGLINNKWINDLCNRRPALIIYFYQIPNGANKSLEEKKIYDNLSEIKKYDDLVYIFLFIINKDIKENPYNFNSDDMQKANNLRNIIQKEYIFELSHDEIWKAIDLGNFATNIVHCCRLYYRRYKIKIKEKKVKSTSREEKIEYNIMLGVLSIMKTKKTEYTKSKYFDEAYNLISEKSYNKSNYLYGNKSVNPKFNLIEVRAVSDWLFYKILKLQGIKKNTSENIGQNSAKNIRSLTNIILGKQTEKNTPSIDNQIEKYRNHIKNFSFLSDCINGQNTDKFIYFEYYWLIQRYKDLCELYEEYVKTNYNKKKTLSLGLIYFKQIYYYIKLIKLLNQIKGENLNIVSIKNKEIQINKIEAEFSQFYGKPPSYSYKDVHNPLMKYDLGFDEDVYFKKFLFEKKLNSEGALNSLYEQNISKAYNLFNNFKNNILKNNSNCGIDLYLNILKLLISYYDKENNVFNISNLKIDENLFNIANSFPILNLENIKKFPKVYLHYLELNINSLLNHMQNSNSNVDNYIKTKLFINLSLLGNLRKLNENEETFFFQLINDELFIPKDINDKTSEEKEIKPIIIKLSKEKNNENCIFDCDYNLKNEDDSHEKKILDLVEYNFKIKSSLSKENLKLNSVKIYFQLVNEDTNNVNENQKKEVIIKEFNKEELSNLDLNADSPINLEHKLFMKYKKGKIYVSQIEFSLCKKENIIYKTEFQNDLDKIIIITNLNKKVLNIKIPKEKITVGVNQLSKFEVEVNKEGFEELYITQFKMNFISIPSYYKKTVPNTSMKALLNNTKTSPGKPNQNTQSLQQQIFGIPKNDNNQNKTMSIIPPQRGSVPNTKINTNINNNVNLKTTNTIVGNQTSMQNFFYQDQNNKQNQGVSNSMTKSQMFPSSSNSMQQNQTPTPSQNLPSKKINVALPPPEFYFYNEESKTLEKEEKKYEKEYKDFESLLKNNKNKFGVLIKFLQTGQYEIKLNINYSIKHRDIEDYIEFSQEETLKFIVIDPFKFWNDIYSNNFMTVNKMKEDKSETKITQFLTNKNIQMSLILTNQLNEDIIIKDIIIQLDEEKLNEKNKNIEVKCPLKNILDSQSLSSEIKDQILKILKSADYTIPFETKFNDGFEGSLGKVLIKWTTPSLVDNEYNDLSLVNENSFDLPYIFITPLELNYEYDTVINENKDVLFNIKVENLSEKCRKLIFIIENGEDINFIVSGMTKQIHSVKAKENLNVVFRLIPLVHNVELKLPFIKISEMSYNSQEKICSNYYYPEKINII